MLLAQANHRIALLADSTWDWFRPGASTVASDVDWLFKIITWICIVFFVKIVLVMVWFIVKYRHRPGHKAEHSPHHNNTIEAIWSIIPLIVVVVIFALGFRGYLDMRMPPDDAIEINVRAYKWAWEFTYPNQRKDSSLHVPINRPVKLILSSDDVIHSLYIPAFRVKMDCVPGRYNTMWFTATKKSLSAGENGEWIDHNDNNRYDTGEGGFDLFCTEYCGTGHSTMLSKVHVYDDDGFRKKMKELEDVRLLGKPPIEIGAGLYKSAGCSQCHSLDGSDRPGNGGPSFKGHWEEQVAWSTGPTDNEVKTVTMDENYIRESILNPKAKVRRGYNPIMPTYQGRFSNDELFALIAFIKNLNGIGTPDWLPREEEGEAAADGDAAAAPAADTPAAETATEEPAAEEPEADAEEEPADESKPEEE